jgi:hypothetical protein
MTDANGLPLVVLVGPANRRDEQLVGPILWLMHAALLAAGLPRPPALQADRGYGFPWTLVLVLAWAMRAVIAPRGSAHGSGLGRTHSWFTRFRRLVQCYERRPEHAQGVHTLAACVILARRLRTGRPRAAPALALAA